MGSISFFMPGISPNHARVCDKRHKTHITLSESTSGRSVDKDVEEKQSDGHNEDRSHDISQPPNHRWTARLSWRWRMSHVPLGKRQLELVLNGRSRIDVAQQRSHLLARFDVRVRGSWHFVHHLFWQTHYSILTHVEHGTFCPLNVLTKKIIW